MKRFGALLLAASLLCLSCRSPLHHEDLKRATLTVSAGFGAASGAAAGAADGRTVVPVLPEIPADLASITVSFASGDGYTAPEPKTKSGAPWAVIFDAVPKGSWTVTVVAKRADGVTIGTGSTTCTLAADTPLTLIVPMVLSDLGPTGDVSFKISVPDTLGIDYVSGVLDGSANPQTPTLTAEAGRSAAVFEYSDLEPGTHTLVLTFKRGGAYGTIAGIFREKIVVVGGYESASWVAADGTLANERALTADEFYDPDAALEALALSSNLFPTGSIPFDPACLSYTLGPIATLPATVTVTATEKDDGQYLEYSCNGSNFTGIKSGTAVTLTVGSINALALRVTAADRATKNVYWVHFSGTLPEGPGSYSVPGGTIKFSVSEGKINITGFTGSPTNIGIPASIGEWAVTGIAVNAFLNCTALTSVTIPDSVTSIGEYAFRYCSGLKTMTIPDSVTSIGFDAFAYCTGLKSVTIPNSVTSIAGYAFYTCTGLTSLTIPDSVTSIGGSAFADCSGLTSVTISNNVTAIESGAFWNCSGLTSVTIPNKVTAIGDSAFRNCSALTSVTIPSSVASIGASAFNGCSSIDYIRFMRPTPPGLGGSALATGATPPTTFYVPDAGALAAYQAAPSWSAYVGQLAVWPY